MKMYGCLKKQGTVEKFVILPNNFNDNNNNE